ncbi:MAG TPA: xanthine dehydrogenase family protein molybdopterin-binding subunit [Armatimonadota bacterium]|nr:xanthine dehydrogenase family protein molybdopterin-binding subunit [Armatimonadota bacterium]
MPKKEVTIQVNGQEKVVEMDVPDSETHLSWGDPTRFKYLYQSAGIDRLDGPWKVTGSARYASDVVMPGLLFGRILRSPYAHAKITSIDLAPAKAMRGVRAAIQLRNPGDQVMYFGDEVAAVAAQSPDIAEDAIRAIKVQYEQMPFVVSETEAIKPDSPKVHANEDSNYQPGHHEQGDIDAAFAAADAVHEAEYGVPARLHVCLEPHGVTAHWTAPDRVTVWASTQGITGVRDDVAQAFNLPADHVEVICEVMGGGFGSKFGMGVEGRAAVQLAKDTGAPVRLLLTRKEEFLAVGNGPSAYAKVKIAGKKDGTMTAYQASGYGTGGIGDVGIALPYIYHFGASKVDYGPVFTNIGASRAFRAPNHPQSSFLTELAVDELAAKLGLDPLEVRRKNDGDPVRMKEYEIGAERIGWNRRNKIPGGTPGPVKRGIGMSSAQWWGGGSPSTTVRVTVNRDGSAMVECGTQDLGTGTRTYVGAIVADELQIPLNRVTVKIGDSNYGPAGGSGGSTTTASVAPAVMGAVTSAREQLLNAVAPFLNAKAGELELSNQTVRVAKTPGRSITWKQACSRLPAGGVTGIVNGSNWPSELQQGGAGGAQFAEVEVDTRTGKVKVLHMVGVHDCGLVMNRKAVESQINGGMILGVGLALLEGRVMDDQTGHMINPNMETYKVAGALEIPPMEAIVYDNPTGKVTGIGEPPNIPGASAIACAVFNAIGVPVRDLPITPKKVLDALSEH